MIKSCPSILTHVIFAVVVIALSAVLSSQVKGDEAPDKRTFCLAAEFLSAEIMARRLQGGSFAVALAQADDQFTGNAAVAMTRIVAQAHNSPLADFTARDDVGIVLEFAAYVRLDCYHNWPRND